MTVMQSTVTKEKLTDATKYTINTRKYLCQFIELPLNYPQSLMCTVQVL